MSEFAMHALLQTALPSEAGARLIDNIGQLPSDLKNHPDVVASTLSRLIGQDENTESLDGYTVLLTAVRGDFFRHNLGHVLDMYVLENSPALLRGFRRAFKADPNGYCAPELVSMWSSIAFELGPQYCMPLMGSVLEDIWPCVATESVGQVVGVLMYTNLSQNADVLPVNCAKLVLRAFHAAFTGDEFQERQWGPGPVSMALSHLARSKHSAMLFDVQVVTQLVQTVIRRPEDWPVTDFPASYHLRASICASKALWHLAERYNLMQVVPDILETLGRHTVTDCEARRYLDGAIAAIAYSASQNNSIGATVPVPHLEPTEEEMRTRAVKRPILVLYDQDQEEAAHEVSSFLKQRGANLLPLCGSVENDTRMAEFVDEAFGVINLQPLSPKAQSLRQYARLHRKHVLDYAPYTSVPVKFAFRKSAQRVRKCDINMLLPFMRDVLALESAAAAAAAATVQTPSA